MSGPTTLREHIAKVEADIGTIYKLATELINSYQTLCIRYNDEVEARRKAQSAEYEARVEAERYKLLVKTQNNARPPEEVAQEIINGIMDQYNL